MPRPEAQTASERDRAVREAAWKEPTEKGEWSYRRRTRGGSRRNATGNIEKELQRAGARHGVNDARFPELYDESANATHAEPTSRQSKKSFERNQTEIESTNEVNLTGGNYHVSHATQQGFHAR
jgi:hypothetical protein